jgi:hypothetical protein
VRPLDQESDKALALLNTLDDTERKQAVATGRIELLFNSDCNERLSGASEPGVLPS